MAQTVITSDEGARGVALRPFEPPPRAARLAAWRYPLAVALASRLVSLVVVAVIGWWERPAGAPPQDALLTPLAAWDGQWYLRIAEHGYDPTMAHGNAAAFFPLYPSLVGTLHSLVPVVSVVVLGSLLSNLLFVAAVVLLHGLTRDRFGEDVARRTVWYVSFAPLAFVFSAVYTESLFLLLVVGTFVLLEQRRGWLACGVAALAVLTRPVGIALLPAIAWRMWEDNARRVDRVLARRLAPLVLLPLAYVAFQAYLWWRTGLPSATELAQERGWGRVFDPWLAITLPVAAVRGVAEAVAGAGDLQLTIDPIVASLMVLLVLDAARRRLVPTEYLLAAAGVLVLPALAGTYLAYPRYGMTVFVLAWIVALHGRRRHVDLALRMGCMAALVGLAIATYGTGTYTP